MPIIEKLDRKEAYKQACEALSRPPCDLHALTFVSPNRVFYYDDEGHGVILTNHVAYITAESAEGLYYGREKITLRDCGSYKRLANPREIWHLHEVPENLIDEVVSSSRQIRVACEKFHEYLEQLNNF